VEQRAIGASDGIYIRRTAEKIYNVHDRREIQTHRPRVRADCTRVTYSKLRYRCWAQWQDSCGRNRVCVHVDTASEEARTWRLSLKPDGKAAWVHSTATSQASTGFLPESPLVSCIWHADHVRPPANCILSLEGPKVGSASGHDSRYSVSLS
jgi:hypothetical protein